MALDFPLPKAEIVAFFLECFLYGALVTLYGITVFVLFAKRRGALNKALLLTSTTMTVLATAHVSIDLYRMIQAFINSENALAYFALISAPTSVIKSVLWVTQTFIGDAFVIYRCYVVWGRKVWIVVFPICMSIGTATAGYGACAAFSRASSGTSVFAISSWITALFSLSLSTNIICTSLVAFRIWYSHRRVTSYSAHSLWPVMIIVIESGAIYSAGLISLLIAYAIGSNGQYPALDAEMPLVGIAFNLIIVRVGLGLARTSSGPSAATRGLGANRPRSQSKPFHSSSRGVASHLSTTDEPYPLQPVLNQKPLAIKVSQVVQQHSDEEHSSFQEVASAYPGPDDKWTPV